MAWVYILRGATGRHYIGSTTHLQRRLDQHARGHTPTTKRLGGSLQLVAARQLTHLSDAHALERSLKKFKNPSYATHVLTTHTL